MARIRSIKPTFWSDEKIGLLPRDVRLTFLGLISAMADDHGRLIGSARIVRGAVYPYDDDVSVADVYGHIVALETAGRIIRYRVAGDDYIQITNWTRHQKVDKPSKSLLPDPSEEAPITKTPTFVEPSSNDSTNDPRTIPTDGKREGGEEEKEMEESGAEAIREPVIRAEDNDFAPPASLFSLLPPQAKRLLETFYEPAISLAQRKRYRDVGMQLVDSIDPKHVGPKLAGRRVKARSVAHLDDCCRSVCENPPNDRDAAVVWVLKKLHDPEKGPSVTQMAADRDAEIRGVELLYKADAKHFSVQWANDHREEYDEILKTVEAEYAGKSGIFAAPAKEARMIHLVTKAGGFMSFDAWQENRQPAGAA